MKTNKEVVMSMVNPSTDALMKRVKSRYGLVVLGAKRARQLLDGEELKATQARSTKNVTNALEEIVEGIRHFCVARDWQPDVLIVGLKIAEARYVRNISASIRLQRRGNFYVFHRTICICADVDGFVLLRGDRRIALIRRDRCCISR